MAAKKFSYRYPPFTFTTFKSVAEVTSFVKTLIRALEDFRIMIGRITNDHATRLTFQTGSGAPSSTPTDTLLFYLDTTAKDAYISVGTASSADWKKITP